MNSTEINEEKIPCDLIDEAITFYTVSKRVIDLCSGLLGCIILIPLYIGVKIAYLLTGDFAPILLKQERIGKNGKPIYIYKFRSMILNADQALMKILKEDKKMAAEYKKYKKLKNDPRITKVGRFIRATSIDEFPQFVNILLGDMSLVGPRPYLFREKKDMGKYYNVIIKCTPGLTGYWQVNGRSGTVFKERLVLDKYYFEHRRFILDCKIILKTFTKVVLKKGAK